MAFFWNSFNKFVSTNCEILTDKMKCDVLDQASMYLTGHSGYYV